MKKGMMFFAVVALLTYAGTSRSADVIIENLKINSGGIEFPDSTIQTTATLEGPQGSIGPVGLQGPDGPEGPQGDPGSSANVIAGEGITVDYAGSDATVNVDVGTGPYQVPHLDSSGKLDPAVLPGVGLSGVAILKDVKAAGVNGGTCTQEIENQRVLNTLEGDTSFISLANNQFTLQPGTYLIDGHAPAVVISQHKIKIVDDIGTDVIMGTIGYSHNTYPTISFAHIKGLITVIQPTTYQLNHLCKYTYAEFGFGIASNLGGDEIYSQLTVMKLQ